MHVTIEGVPRGCDETHVKIERFVIPFVQALRSSYIEAKISDDESATLDLLTDILVYSGRTEGEIIQDLADRAARAARDELTEAVNRADVRGAEAVIDVIVIRDPDASNEIHVFGDDEAVIVDIDLGHMDLSDPEEFQQWQDFTGSLERLHWKDAAKLLKSVVAETAANHGHPVPSWTE